MASVAGKALHRDEQARQLKHFLRAGDLLKEWRFIHCFGLDSTGKTTTIESVLKQQQLRYVLVDCVECCASVKLLFRAVLSSLGEDSFRCDTFEAFISTLNSSLSEGSSLVIVLEHAERLRAFPHNILAVLCRLSEFTSNVRLITVSVLPWSNFLLSNSATPLLDVPQVFFPNYSKEEAVDLLDELKSEDYGEMAALYRQFCKLVVETFMVSCRDVRQLQHVTAVNWPRLLAPVESGELEATQLRRLWDHVKPILRASRDAVFTRELDEPPAPPDAAVVAPTAAIDMPRLAKLALVAAYLASYNPPKSDKRYFLKFHGKERRVWKDGALDDVRAAHNVGPRLFPLERLKHIFLMICERRRNAVEFNLLGQVKSFVSVGLLVQASADGNLHAPKFRCAAALDFVRPLARTVDFDLMSYLYDFN